MTAPRKRGRPAHAPGATTLGVRLTADQRRALETAAKGLDLSTWVRERILIAAGRPDLAGLGSASGWNVYRWLDDGGVRMEWVGTSPSEATALALARSAGAHQIQEGRDGRVIPVG